MKPIRYIIRNHGGSLDSRLLCDAFGVSGMKYMQTGKRKTARICFIVSTLFQNDNCERTAARITRQICLIVTREKFEPEL